MAQIESGQGRRQIRFEELTGALAGLTRQSLRNRGERGWLPELARALGRIDLGLGADERADGADGSLRKDGSLRNEVVVLHLAALDIALQVDGRFNGLHQFLLGSVLRGLVASRSPPLHPQPSEDGAIAGDGSPARDRAPTGAGTPETDGRVKDSDLHHLLRARLPLYLKWMLDFVSAQLEPDVHEPRQVLGLKDPADSAVVILTLGELVSLYHRTLSTWDLVA